MLTHSIGFSKILETASNGSLTIQINLIDLLHIRHNFLKTELHSLDDWWHRAATLNRSLKRHVINWSEDNAILHRVLSRLRRVFQHTIISSTRLAHPFYHLASLSKVSCCHFSPLNGFNCPDDLNQKTITKGKSSTGNYCPSAWDGTHLNGATSFHSGKITCAAWLSWWKSEHKVCAWNAYVSVEKAENEKTLTLQSRPSKVSHMHEVLWRNSGQVEMKWESRLRGTVSIRFLLPYYCPIKKMQHILSIWQPDGYWRRLSKL